MKKNVPVSLENINFKDIKQILCRLTFTELAELIFLCEVELRERKDRKHEDLH